MGLPMYEKMGDIITLNGIIKELGSKGYFKVSVGRDEDVYDLKAKILEEQGKYFQAFDAMNLKVWSVQVARNSTKLDDIKDESASIESILAGKEARSIDKITSHFEEIDENHVHFVVRGEKF
jgi:hypothetical protein